MQFVNTYILAIPRALWKTWFLLMFLLFLIILYPIFYFLLRGNAPYKSAFKLMRFWAKCNLLFSGIILKKIEYEIEKINGPCIIVANHNSYLDILVSYAVVNKYFVFIGKHELKHAPLFNIFFKKMNILVDRGNASSGANAYSACINRVKQGESVFIFPEGLINANPNLKPFKNGAFKLAIDMKIPILPITFYNNDLLLQSGGYLKANGRPGIAKVIVHKPIYTTTYSEKDITLLKNIVFNIINDGLTKHES